MADPTQPTERRGREAPTHGTPIEIPSALERAFARMTGVGSADIKFRIGDFLFRQRQSQPNQIKIYAGKKHYLGKVSNRAFYPLLDGKAATPEVQRNILTILEDPKRAAFEHGKTSGCCAICGTALTDPASLLIGIGPVCLHNFGWADDDLEVEDL